MLLILALSIPALAAEPKKLGVRTGNADNRPTSDTHAAGSTVAGDKVTPVRPARKNRVRQTFPPSTTRM
jgi:hypothetical protein